MLLYDCESIIIITTYIFHNLTLLGVEYSSN